MRKSAVDLNSHVNQTHLVGNPASFPLTVVPAMYRNPVTGLVEEIRNRDTSSRVPIRVNRFPWFPIGTHSYPTTVIEAIDRALRRSRRRTSTAWNLHLRRRRQDACNLQISRAGARVK